MKRLVGYLAIALAAIGLAGCLAVLIAIWVARPMVLRSSVEILDSADGALTLVEEKATRADALVTRIRSTVDPVAGRILQLADKTERTPEDQKELSRIEEELAERLRQIDSIAETVETALGFLNKTTRLTGSLPAFKKPAGPAAVDDSRAGAESLARLTTKLKELRGALAKLRDEQVQKEIFDLIVRVAREVDESLKLVDTRLSRMRQRATEGRTEVAELRIEVPVWANSTAIIGSVILAWMGLGQLVLLCRAWSWARPKQPSQ